MPNYPTSLDTLTNPASGDPLSSPAHHTQHTDANDILEAVETKLGTGASTPTTTGHVLTVTGAGATAYQAAGGAVSEGRTELGAPNYVIPGVELLSVTTGAVTANRTYYFPWYVATAITLDRIAIEVTTGAGTTARLGIFAATTLWQPGALILDAGNVATDTSGIKAATINQQLSAGRYLAAFNGTGAATLRRIRGGNRYAGIHYSVSSSPFFNMFQVSETIASYPDPGTAWDADSSDSNPFSNFVFARLSAA